MSGRGIVTDRRKSGGSWRGPVASRSAGACPPPVEVRRGTSPRATGRLGGPAVAAALVIGLSLLPSSWGTVAGQTAGPPPILLTPSGEGPIPDVTPPSALEFRPRPTGVPSPTAPTPTPPPTLGEGRGERATFPSPTAVGEGGVRALASPVPTSPREATPAAATFPSPTAVGEGGVRAPAAGSPSVPLVAAIVLLGAAAIAGLAAWWWKAHRSR